MNNEALKVGVALHTLLDSIALMKKAARAGRRGKKKSREGATISLPKEPIPVLDVPQTAQPPEAQFLGFRSAAGREITVSDKALQRAQRLLSDCSQSQVLGPPPVAPILSLSVCGDADAPREMSMAGFSVGFTSGRGKPVAITEDSLKRAAKLFEDSQPIQPEAGGFTIGFTSGFSGKAVAISGAAISKAKKLFEDDFEEKPKREFSVGFSSGSGKTIAISEESLARAKRLFEDDIDNQPASTITERFSNNRSSNVPLSLDGERKGKQLLEVTPEFEKPHIPIGFGVGFSSGSGKSVSFSAESLAKAKQLLSGDCFDTPIFEENPTKPSCKVKFCDPIKTKGKSHQLDTLKRRRDAAEPTNLSTVGFTTPKFSGQRMISEPSTKRVNAAQKPAKKTDPEKPNMRAYLNIDTLGSHQKIGKFAHINPARALDDLELREIEQSIIDRSDDIFPGKSIEKQWIRDQLRLCLWKFASYSQRFPGFDSLLSEASLQHELQRRYEKEADLRSTVTRLQDRDSLPGSRMVLLVGTILHACGHFQVELSDGWHSLTTDVEDCEPFGTLFLTRKVRCGMKLEVCNCTFDGEALRLRINSVRLARWDASLGLSPVQIPFRVSIASIKAEGGTVPSLEAIVLKRYPPRYFVHSHRKSYSQSAFEELQPSNELRFSMSCLLRIKDAVPTGKASECYITLERIGYEQYEALREGIFVRLFGLEVSRYRPTHNGSLHLTTRLFHMSRKKPIPASPAPISFLTDTTDLDTECAIVGCLAYIDSSPSGEILRLHLLTAFNEFAEVKIHSHPFFGERLTKLKRMTEGSAIMLSNCVRDLDPKRTRLAVASTDESELLTYLQADAVKHEAEAVGAIARNVGTRFALHLRKCGAGHCNCREG